MPASWDRAQHQFDAHRQRRERRAHLVRDGRKEQLARAIHARQVVDGFALPVERTR
jgi:hypothetical protein